MGDDGQPDPVLVLREVWNRQVIESIRLNGGRVGEEFAPDIDPDLNAESRVRALQRAAGLVKSIKDGMPMLLLHHRGARSGVTRVSPLVYGSADQDVAVFASNGGSRRHPAWYHNVAAHPDVVVELDGQPFKARAHVVTELQRAAFWDRQTRLYPQFAAYERIAGRVIPVVVLQRLEGDDTPS